MENAFFGENIIVTGIANVWNGLYMPRSKVMKKREYCGLVLIIDDHRDYIFYRSESLTEVKEVISVKPGNILWLPVGSTYRISNAERCNCISINFNTSEISSCEPFCVDVSDRIHMYKELFSTADQLWKRRPQGYVAGIMSALYQVICLMQKSYHPAYMRRELSDKMQGMIKYINTHYMEPLSVDGLARMLGMSTVYFRRVFTNFSGIQPSKYIKHTRIRSAMSLLKADMYTIEEVAEMTGFSDRYYFSREFKRITGVSPTAYSNSDRGDRDIN